MIVPNLTGIAKAVAGVKFAHNTSETTAASTASIRKANYTAIPRRRRGWGDFDISSAFFKASGSPGRSVAAPSGHVNEIAERQTCASGLTYYSCASGFRGCCAGNPCNSNTSCSLEGPESSASPSATGTRTGTGTRTATSTGTRTATGTASGTASRSGTRTSTRASGTNSATQSNTGTAASTMPANSSTTTTPTISALPDTQSGGSNVGAIAGGAVGGVAALVFILALLAFLVRRHRKMVDSRREAEKLKNSIRPAAAPDGRHYGTHEINGHHRSGSTANDAYTLQGGSYYTPQHTRQRSIFRDEDRNWV